jgi:hypothetical protein
MRQARYWRALARREAFVELYRAEPPDFLGEQAAAAGREWMATLAADRSGHLGRARRWAHQALTRARAQEERYQAILQLTRIEYDAGRHKEEFRLAEKLMAMRPVDLRSQAALVRAAYGTGDVLPARKVAATIPISGDSTGPVSPSPKTWDLSPEVPGGLPVGHPEVGGKP